MRKIAVLLAVLMSVLASYSYGEPVDLLDQQGQAVQGSVKAKEAVTRYSFLKDIKRLNPVGHGEPFEPALDGLDVPNTPVNIPATCLPGIGEGVCDGDYVSASGACYGMVVVTANYYRRVVRRVAAGKSPVTRWDAASEVEKIRRMEGESIFGGLDWNVNNVDPNDADGINKMCSIIGEKSGEGEAFFKKDKSTLTAIRLSQICMQLDYEEAVQGAALWHQIDQEVPGRQNLPIPSSGDELHKKMEALRNRIDKHGLATILWKHRDNKSPASHAFLLYGVNEVEVKRGGGNSETAWELRLYDPNIKYNLLKRNKMVVYYLPSQKRMTFSKELISHYTKRGVNVQGNSEFIDGDVDELCETTPEVWNTNFLAKTIIYKLRRKYVPGLVSTHVD